ncbi:cAMP-dependent protein kinase type II regulatory subunit-like isoform X2 [Watersipora subatra]|uniref:cAMP-dependent protein kinase type II regulatory subunit-like isoform X2 n=1 Tax=Watersipora subatra TaxID=2589382 RepID=UPI00355BFDED
MIGWTEDKVTLMTRFPAMPSTDYQVPEGLTELLQGFTVAVLRNQPANLNVFARDYFERQCLNDLTNPEYSYNYSDEESECESPPPEYISKQNYRRKSVSAERYDPAESDGEDAGEVRTVNPKTDEQRLKLNEAVKNILIFKALDTEQLGHVLDAMCMKEVKAGQEIITQGDEDADFFYVIQSGKYDTFVKDSLVFTYDNAGSFGELALMYNTPRAATITASTDGTLWTLDRNSFRKIVLKSAFLKRRMYEDFIESLPILKSLEAYERTNVCDALTSKTYEDGTEIICEGDEALCMYFIEVGEVRVMRTGANGENREVNRLTKGEYFGELGLISKKPRAASVFAVGQVKCAVLDVEAFERLLGPCMDILRRNSEGYEEDMIRVFGGKDQIADLR